MNPVDRLPHRIPQMNQTVELTAPVPLTGPPASQNSERGRTHGMPFIFWVLEQNIWVLLSAPTAVIGRLN